MCQWLVVPKKLLVIYYMGKGILLRTKTLVMLIRQYIWDLSGVFSVCQA